MYIEQSYFWILCVFVQIFSSCASLPGSKIEKIAGKEVEFVQSDGNTPTVVFENGLGGKFDWWAKIYPEIAKTHASFAYNRPGYGKSSNFEGIHDGSNSVEMLREILKAKNILPPYILVGHSLGGLYFQLWIRKYPEEVAGLVLVDSTHPNQLSGDGDPQKWSWWVRNLFNLLTSDVEKDEFNNISKTGLDVLSYPPVNVKKNKIIILSATEPEDPNSRLEKDILEKKKDFLRLYPGATQIWVKGGHAIPLNSPEVVIEAIRKVSEVN